MASNSILSDLGKVDNLNDPQPVMNKKGVILGIVFSFLAVSSLGATGRLYIRSCVTRNLGLDDVFVFLSLVFNIAAAVALFLLTSIGGLGQHFILLGVDGMERFLRIFYVANALYCMSAAFIKLALLFQYLRILEKGSRLRTVTIFFILTVSLWGAAFTIMSWMPCLPVYAFWDLTISDSSVMRYAFGSIDLNTLASTFFGHAASNIFLNMTIISIPVPVWIRSNAEKRTRVALLGLFVLGAMVNICSIFRLVYLIQNRAATSPTFDPTWYGSSPIVLSAVEVHLATICASLPVFWPIVKDVLASKGIIVTHEVMVKRESRKFDDFDVVDGHDMHSLNSVSSNRPWEHIHNKSRPPPRGVSSKPTWSVSAAPKLSLDLPVMRDGTPDSGLGLPFQTADIETQGRYSKEDV